MVIMVSMVRTIIGSTLSQISILQYGYCMHSSSGTIYDAAGTFRLPPRQNFAAIQFFFLPHATDINKDHSPANRILTSLPRPRNKNAPSAPPEPELPHEPEDGTAVLYGDGGGGGGRGGGGGNDDSGDLGTTRAETD